MFNFVFDKKSLVLLLAGLTVAGSLLFLAGLLVGVNLGLPGTQQAAYIPRPLPARLEQPARPCPEPAVPAERPAPTAPAPEPEPSPEPVQIAEETEPPPPPPPAPVEPPAPRPRAVPASYEQASGRFSLQVGAFSQKENSDAVVRELESRGYQPYVVEMPGSKRVLLTVRVGRYEGRGEALRAASEFRQREKMSAIVQRVDRL